MRTELPRAETGRRAWAVLLAACALGSVAWGATYYADASATGAADGSSWSDAWPSAAAAIAGLDAIEGNGGGHTLLCRGNLGPWIEGAFTDYGSDVPRADWLIVRDDDGTGRLTYITVYTSSDVDVYLRFEDLLIRPNDPDPWPEDDGQRHAGDYPTILYTRNAQHFYFSGCEITGVTDHGKYLTAGPYLMDCGTVTLTASKVHNVNRGWWLVGTKTDPTVSGNLFYDIGEFSIIRIGEDSFGDVVIANNHIHSTSFSEDDPYYSGVDPVWHPGSCISIRAAEAYGEPTWDHCYIRGNLIHNIRTHTQSIKLYGGATNWEYCDLTVENNCVYDAPYCPLWYLKPSVGRPVVIRNNSFIGPRQEDALSPEYKIIDRYKYTMLHVRWFEGYDPNALTMTNNVVVGARYPIDGYVDGSLTQIGWADVDVDHNFWWAPSGRSPYGDEGAGEIYGVWRDESLTLHGNPNYLEDIGWTGSTAEYDYAVDGITPVFVSPGFDTGSIYDEDRGKQWDYRLITGSPLINAGDSAAQSSTSLGSLGADGFLRNDGVARDASHHSLGAYEFGTPPDEWVMEGGNGGNGGGTTRYFLGSR